MRLRSISTALAVILTIACAGTAASAETAAADTLRTINDTSAHYHMPLTLTARDFVTKVYGVLSPTVTADCAERETSRLIDLTPSADSTGLWLETADGYSVSYYGMTPDVSALARFGNGLVSDFGFFFIFPYPPGRRDSALASQSEFCGLLLQELNDIGLDLQLNPMSDAMFEATGRYDGNFVEVRLVEQLHDSNIGGRFIMMLSIEPGAFSPSDDVAAL